MRFFLLIPVCILFLSNVPFTQEVPMEKMMAMMKKQEEEKCCKNSTAEKQKSCHSEPQPEPEPAPMACHNGTMPVDGACQPTGSTCVCICVFQFAAPAQDLKIFQFNPENFLAGRTGYVDLKWKDPHIASPGQPPDFI